MTKVSHVVVDGSNIATEGRSTPSLAQLEGAVKELHHDLPDAMVIVVVDATFAHRIDESERERFEQALLRREYVSPPAGAIGRGDAFLLRIAERVEATVLSNDSFQEFHGEHKWLFDTGRLLGATPVPGVGWIFVPRAPVRGPKSHVALRDSRKAQSKVEKAIAAATKEAVGTPAAVSGNGPNPGASEPSPVPEAAARRSPQAVNEPLTFIEFVASHPLGVTVSGVVQAFTSHGAVVSVGGVRCYVPLSGLGEPAPRSAREVLHKNEPREFVVTALDPQRRGVELALPEVAVVSGKPSDETVEAEVALAKPRSRRTRAATEPVAPSAAKRTPRSRRAAPPEEPPAPAPAPARVPRKAAAKKTVATALKAAAAKKSSSAPVAKSPARAPAPVRKAGAAAKTSGARTAKAAPATPIAQVAQVPAKKTGGAKKIGATATAPTPKKAAAKKVATKAAAAPPPPAPAAAPSPAKKRASKAASASAPTSKPAGPTGRKRTGRS